VPVFDFEPANLIALLPCVYLIAVAVPLSVIDIKQRRLPNRLVLPGIALALIAQALASAVSRGWMSFLVSVALGVAAFLLFWLVNSIGAIGMGDVKLITLIVLCLAWFDWVWAALAIGVAFVLATILVLIGFTFRRSRIGSTIPLGPYLLAGFASSVTALVLS
jgi:leader peptidase (prepilin peptidase) / N-methyltransferase